MKTQNILQSFAWCSVVGFLIVFNAEATNYDFKNFIVKGGIRATSNPVMDTVLEYLDQFHQSIGHRLASDILSINNNFDLGSKNFSGFTWQKPMGYYFISANRQLSPDLFHDTRWIVSDNLTFYIDAFSYLKNLDESGIIDITKLQLASFAGIKFKREYRYIHYANNYVEGLTSDYSKLFLSFRKFKNLSFEDNAPYEFITKADYISIRAGALAHIPVYGPLTMSGAVLASYNKLSNVSIQSLGPEDKPNPGEFLRLSMEKIKGKSLLAQASLVLDFFELLKITLLSYEHDYSYDEAYKIHLSFYDRNIETLTSNTPVQREVKKMLRLKRPDQETLKEHIVSNERRVRENQNSHYRILMLGKVKKKETEHVTIQKNGISKTFFRHQTESIKYIKGIFSFLLEGLKKFTNINLATHYKATRIRKLTMEYEGAQSLDQSDNEHIDSEDKLSIKVFHAFTAKNTLKKSSKKFKQYAIHFLARFTTVPIDVTHKLYEDELVGPLKITFSGRINSDGISFFNQLSQSYVEKVNAHVCKFNLQKIEGPSKSYRCFKKLRKLYSSYIQEYHAEGLINLWKLKEYLFEFVKRSDNKNDLGFLVGSDGQFIHGTFSAFTNDNHQFLTYYHKGEFQGLGIIDNYIKSSGIGGPTLITD